MTVAWGLLSAARINRAVIEAGRQPVPSTTGSVR
jgi:hypothetical protein